MRFLSDEHLAAATAALKESGEIRQAATGVTLSILYTVSGGPDGDFTYYIKIADGAVEMARGVLAAPDAEVRSSYETAVGLSRSEIVNQTAVMMGKVRIKGSMLTLMRHTALLNRVQAMTSALAVTY